MKSWVPTVTAILVLVVIALISGALLSVLSDVFFVSDEERTNRDLAKVYQSESFKALEINSSFGKKDGCEIVYVYEADDGAIVIKAKGEQGYKGQSEIVMAVKDGKISNMIVSSFGGDDKTTSIKAKYLAQYTGMDITANLKFVSEGTVGAGEVDVSSGASAHYTMKSISSAANMAVYYLWNTKTLGMGGDAQ